MQVTGADSFVHLLPRAFPGLCQLTLVSVQLGDGALLDMLSIYASMGQSLNSLQLIRCSISNAALQHAAVVLGQLPSLKALHLEGGAFTARGWMLAEHLTQLTSLDLKSPLGNLIFSAQLAAVIIGNAGLQRLALNSAATAVIQTTSLQQVLTSCRELTHLALENGSIDDQGLDVLLQHGTNITHLTLGDSNLTVSKSDRQAPWQELQLPRFTLAQLAYLPVKSVKS
jgi:hypothetical protein